MRTDAAFNKGKVQSFTIAVQRVSEIRVQTSGQIELCVYHFYKFTFLPKDEALDDGQISRVSAHDAPSIEGIQSRTSGKHIKKRSKYC